MSKEDHSFEINKIDQQMMNILISAEKQCRKLRAEAISYSPELLRAGLQWRFWRKLTYHKLNRFYNLEWINQMAVYLHIENHMSISY